MGYHKTLSPFCGFMLTVEEQEFNRDMSAVRVAVEWSFGKIIQYFSYLDFRKHQKILLQPIGEVLPGRNSAHQLPHMLIWLTDYQLFCFEVKPPSLETYLSNQ